MTDKQEEVEMKVEDLELPKDKTVEPDNELKQMFINYVGHKLQPPDGNITVDMVVSVLADEFPEFLLVVAEENFLRGYEQAYVDIENWNKRQKQTAETGKVDPFQMPEEILYDWWCSACNKGWFDQDCNTMLDSNTVGCPTCNGPLTSAV